MSVVLGVLLACLAIVPAFATDPTVDYSALLTSGQTTLYAAVTIAAPILFAIFATMCALKWVFKWFGRVTSR
jgi:hypothetical protein